MGTTLTFPRELMAFGLLAFAGTGNAASLAVKFEAEVPTQQFSAIPHDRSEVATSLNWIAFAKAAIPDARSLQDWERQDVDDFFWAHFE